MKKSEINTIPSKKKVYGLSSVKQFEINIKRTNKLINSIIGNIVATEAMFSELSKRNKKILDHPITKSLKVEEEDKAYIYELGFIALFANFEALMFFLLKDLSTKYPKSISESGKSITVEEILKLKTGKRIKEYVVDDLALNNSTSIEKWGKFLESNYNIKAFPGTKFETQLCVMNELRNLYLHSQGITNSLFVKNLKKYFNMNWPLNQSVGFINKEKYFFTLLDMLKRESIHLNTQ
ncbi:MAG: hypothetical protein WC851_03455 [Candidatus Shapirobacteria bacterium]|jgi:hypothetical protein